MLARVGGRLADRDRRDRRDGAAHRLRPRLPSLAGLPAGRVPAGARATTPTSSSRTASSRRSPCSRRSCSPSARCMTRALAALGEGARMARVRRNARAGAARRDHGLLRPESVARHLAPAALARRARGSACSCCSRRRARCAARRRALPAIARLGGAVLLAAVSALVVTGTLATAAGPHPGKRDRSAASARSSRRSTCTCARPPPSGSSSSCSPPGRGASARAIRGFFAAAPACSSCSASQMAIGEIAVPERPAVGARARARHGGGVRLRLDGRARRPALAAGRAGAHVESVNVGAEHLVHAGVAPAGPRRGFRGWNDGGQGASLAAGYLAKQWDGERFAEIDSGDVLRLPGDAAARLARGRDDAQARLARERVLPRGDPGHRPRRGHPARRRAEPPLEDVLAARARARAATSASSASSRSARCSPTCRTRGRRR